MTLVGFIADQRTTFGVSQAVACRTLGVSESWFYKWRSHTPSGGEIRRRALDEAVKGFFDASDGTYGSPRILEDLRDDGWAVSKKTVEVSMRRQGLAGRPKKTKRGLTRADRRARKAPDRLNRDFSAETQDEKWCGDMERHEARWNRAVVKGHRSWSVVADRGKLRAA